MNHFEYDEKALDHLRQQDVKLAQIIDDVGMIKRSIEPDLFKALISGIVSQQISTKAAQTVFGRLKDLIGVVTPETILAQTDDEIKACGLSYRKVGYIKGVCEAIKDGRLDLDGLGQLSDEDVITELVKLKGIGVWSAEMLMIFSLGRRDVLSYGDLVIRKGLMKLHGLDDLSKQEFAKYKALYSPYGSVASLYLWKLANE